MSIFDDLKAKADANDDGRLSVNDLDGLKDKIPTDQFDKLKEMADQNGDGKVSLDDIKGFSFGDVKDKLGGLFGK